MVKKVTFLGFRGGDRPSLGPPLLLSNTIFSQEHIK